MLTAGFPRCLQSQRLAWSLQPVQWVRRLQLATGQQRNPHQPPADHRARGMERGRAHRPERQEDVQEFGGESNRLFH